MKLLEEQDESDHGSWETRYCLLLWLSIIVIIPFDIRKLDGTIQSDESTILKRFILLSFVTISIIFLFNLYFRLVRIVMKYLCSGDACRDTATVLATRLFIRSDVKEVHMPNFLKWAKQVKF